MLPHRVLPAPVHPPLLGDLERSVMDYLWDRGAADAKLVHKALGKARGITLNTIQSTLKRLFDKGLLVREKVSHAHIYQPCLSRDAFQRAALGEIVAALMDGKADAMVSAFVDLTERAGPEHLERLEKLVADRRKKKRERR